MVRANRGLARGILDASWGRLVECLRYKLAWSGGQLVEVPAHYSSQTCHVCGAVDAASRRTQARFCCTGCGVSMHADVNAALVLKPCESLGSACGGMGARGRPAKQETVECPSTFSRKLCPLGLG